MKSIQDAPSSSSTRCKQSTLPFCSWCLSPRSEHSLPFGFCPGLVRSANPYWPWTQPVSQASSELTMSLQLQHVPTPAAWAASEWHSHSPMRGELAARVIFLLVLWPTKALGNEKASSSFLACFPPPHPTSYQTNQGRAGVRALVFM